MLIDFIFSSVAVVRMFSLGNNVIIVMLMLK